MRADPISPILAGKRVVVVEDEALLLLSYRKQLTQAGLIVTTARTAEEGLALIIKEHPDLVITDISLPGMDGLELTRRVASEISVPIVVVSAYPIQYFRPLAMGAGACHYITKPVFPDLLIAVCETCLTVPM